MWYQEQVTGVYVHTEPLKLQSIWATGPGHSPLFTPMCCANVIIFYMFQVLPKVVKPCYKSLSYCFTKYGFGV